MYKTAILFYTKWILISCLKFDTCFKIVVCITNILECYCARLSVSFKQCYCARLSAPFKHCYCARLSVSFKQCYCTRPSVSFKQCYCVRLSISFKQCYCARLSVSFKQCSTVIFIFIALFSEGQVSKAWKHSNKTVLFLLSGSISQRCAVTFFCLQNINRKKFIVLGAS